MKKLICAVCMLIMAALLGACSGGGEEKVPVQSVGEIVGLGSLGVAQRFSGVVSTQDPVKIMKNGDTKIGEVYVEEGDEVKEGDELFTYDTDQLTLDLEKARLELEKLYNDIQNMQKERAQLEEDKAKASADQQLEYSLEINSKDTEILEANYNSAVKQKEIESLERSLENASVKAPSAGKIGSITDGEKTDNMGNTLPVITIIQTNELLVKGSINETNIYSLTPGMEVLIRSRINDQTWMGTLSGIDMDNPVQNTDMYYMDSSDNTATSSKYPFTVRIDDPEGLMLGQHVYVEPFYGEDGSDSWYLPAWYISDIDSDPYVWTEGSGGKLEKRSVTLGDHNGDMDSYVITSGLAPEDKIAFPDENTHEGMICVDYREYVPEEDINGGGEYADDGMIDEEFPEGEEFYDEDEEIFFEEDAEGEEIFFEEGAVETNGGGN